MRFGTLRTNPNSSCREWSAGPPERRLLAGFKRPSHSKRRPRCAGFTLAEVLAALLFMAIVIPVAIEAMHLASRAGSVAARKSEAAVVAQRVLGENLVTTNWSQSVQSGTISQGQRQFRYKLQSEAWSSDPQNIMRQLTVTVYFTAQNREFSVAMSTLVDSSQQ